MKDFKFAIVLVAVLCVRNSDQVPVRETQANGKTAVEDPVYTYEVDPIENRGVELTEGFLIEGDIRLWYGLAPEPSGDVQSNPAETISLQFVKRTSSSFASPPIETNSHQTRNSVSNEESWTDKLIPYVIDPNFNSTELLQIHYAMQNITASVQNCVEFIPRRNEEDFIYITGQGTGCWSDVGKKGGNQTVSISRVSGCVSKGIIIHELLHALGFWHEHNRPDRDNFIQIIKSNIRIDHLGDFHINQNGKILVKAYDYYSIMHYKTNQFSKNYLSLKTISILQPGIDESMVGQRERLSKYDVQRITKLYNCQKYGRSVDKEPVSNREYEEATSTVLPTEKGPMEVIMNSKISSAKSNNTEGYNIIAENNQMSTYSSRTPSNEAEVGRK